MANKRPDLVDLLEIIASSNIRQEHSINSKNSGYCLNSSPAQIMIDIGELPREKVAILIHEAIHLYYFSSQANVSEQRVIAEERYWMRKLYHGRR